MKSQHVFIYRNQFDSATASFTEYISLDRNYKHCCVKDIVFGNSVGTIDTLLLFYSNLFGGIFAHTPDNTQGSVVVEAEFSTNNDIGYQSNTYKFNITDTLGAIPDFATNKTDISIHLHFYDDESYSDCKCN